MARGYGARQPGLPGWWRGAAPGIHTPSAVTAACGSDKDKDVAVSDTSTTQRQRDLLQVVQAGFTLHGRILRPALVVVAKAPGGAPGAAVDTTV